VIVGNHTASQFATRLRRGGVRLCVGPFVVDLSSELRFLAEALHLLYHDFEVTEDDGVADFHIRVQRPGNLRRWFRAQSVFTFDGQQVFRPFPLRLALPLYEWGFNYCVASRSHQFLVVHAGVLERDGGVLVLPGPPGSGKSTLTAALCQRGWRLMSDELALIRCEDGMIVPVPRPVGLKDASIGIIRQFAPDAVFGPHCADTAKGTVAHMRPPQASVRQANQVAPLAWVVFPQFAPGAAAAMQPVPRAEAFLRLAGNAFNYSVLGPQGFETLAKAMEPAHCFACSYSNLDQALTLIGGLPAPGMAVSPAAGCGHSGDEQP
jgi:HprK-related kinase A